MGQYMLKGYRMLDKSCPICGTVLLQTPMSEGGTKYCVGCIDVDGGNFLIYTVSEESNGHFSKWNRTESNWTKDYTTKTEQNVHSWTHKGL